MILLLLAQSAVQAPAAATPAPPSVAESAAARYDQCVDLATDDPQSAVDLASQWRSKGGGFIARQCLGLAYSHQQKWTPAAEEFTAAAQEAEVARDSHAAQYWAQAGNAWIATGQPTKARAALDAALAAGTLAGLERGEVQFDRARAFVAIGDLDSARADIDKAIELAPADPLIWLASAALARRMEDLPRARKDVAEAFRLSADDSSVYLEIGNIAALAGDEAGARSAWNDAIRIAPSSPAAESARTAMQQFATDPPKP
ncbi:MAG: tetratricopeptide repeat protein [Sphingomonas sp.]|nr:tetratricopeptide repeat protein [Sphingomonas sp.]